MQSPPSSELRLTLVGLEVNAPFIIDIFPGALATKILQIARAIVEEMAATIPDEALRKSYLRGATPYFLRQAIRPLTDQRTKQF